MENKGGGKASRMNEVSWVNGEREEDEELPRSYGENSRLNEKEREKE